MLFPRRGKFHHRHESGRHSEFCRHYELRRHSGFQQCHSGFRYRSGFQHCHESKCHSGFGHRSGFQQYRELRNYSGFLHGKKFRCRSRFLRQFGFWCRDRLSQCGGFWSRNRSFREPVRRLVCRPEALSREFVIRPFWKVIDVSDVVRRKRRGHTKYIVVRCISTLLIIGAIAVALLPATMQARSSHRMRTISDSVSRTIEGWPYSTASEMLRRAHAYNRGLYIHGQPVLGEAVDPFSTEASRSAESIASGDGEYQGLLDAGAGIMGTVLVPRIGVELPIRHGTSEQVLAIGAGHLYGTSLPVGGKSTHAVITGHRGLADALMFTRLDELGEGDFMYVTVMGKTLGYQVDRVDVIEPNDVSLLKIVPGEDRLTLMTCTPYGVNTHRLLVSGHRVSMPVPAPMPENVHDARTIGLCAFAACMGVGVLAVFAVSRMTGPRRRAMRHAAAWPARG